METLPQSPRPDPPRWVERRAKLFEAGAYPDKGVTVSAADLARLAVEFQSAVPILIEHADSPLQMGYLVAVEASGPELYGTLRFRPEANALIEASGARSLSVGLSPDLRQIHEVSLVKNPRVASAQIYSGTEGHILAGEWIRFDSEFATEPDYQADYERLCRQRDAERIDRDLDTWQRQGKLNPAERPFARALLMTREVVAFGQETRAVAQIARQWIEQRPASAAPAAHRATAASDLAAPQEAAKFLLLPEEAAFYQRHFPDISLEEIARIR